MLKRILVRLVSAAMLMTILSIMMIGAVSAHPSQTTQIADQNTVSVPPPSVSELPAVVQNALKQLDPQLLEASKQAYEESKLHPEKVHVETYTVDLSTVKLATGVRPNFYIPGVGSITIRVYLLGVVPAGFGLFMPQATAQNLEAIGTAAAAAITAAIIAHNPNLTPYAAIIGAVIGNMLNTVPGYIDHTCGAQGGGFTVNFVVPAPVSFCGALPTWPL
jgi:hypothetical protein